MKRSTVLILLLLYVSVFPQKNFEEMKVLAQKGDKEAQFNLGMSYYLFKHSDGKGIMYDCSQAFYWFNLAANQGHIKA